MAISHVVVLAGALLTLLCLPCVLMAVSGNQIAFRRAGIRQMRHLDRAIHEPPCAERIAIAQQHLPAIEQIAGELRRLNRQRYGGPSLESEMWSAAVVRAYDSWLWAACRRLDVEERLLHLDGDDREIERLRVERELEAAGLVFRPAAGRGPR
jgi:hypothetical protein